MARPILWFSPIGFGKNRFSFYILIGFLIFPFVEIDVIFQNSWEFSYLRKKMNLWTIFKTMKIFWICGQFYFVRFFEFMNIVGIHEKYQIHEHFVIPRFLKKLQKIPQTFFISLTFLESSTFPNSEQLLNLWIIFLIHEFFKNLRKFSIFTNIFWNFRNIFLNSRAIHFLFTSFKKKNIVFLFMSNSFSCFLLLIWSWFNSKDPVRWNTEKLVTKNNRTERRMSSEQNMGNPTSAPRGKGLSVCPVSSA